MSNFTKSLKYGANTFILSITVLLIIVIINFFSYQYHFRWDLTKSEKYSLSEQTKKILNSLEDKIKILCFFQEEAQGKDLLKGLLKEYSYSSRKIEYKFIDPDKNPKAAKKYNISEYNTILIEGRNQVNKINGISEQDITNAIIKITRKEKKSVYFVEGHGEKDIDAGAGLIDSYSIAKAFLIKQRYEVKKISLLSINSLPDDCSVIIIGGPKKEFLEKEKDILKAYLLSGGKAIFLLDPDSNKDLDPFLKEFGIRMERDFIIDKMSQILGADDFFIPIVSVYGTHEITRNFHFQTSYKYTQSISSEIGREQTDLNFIPLALTTENTWSKKNPETIEFNPKEDKKGPFIVACAVTKTNEANKAKNVKIIVYGDSDFISNAWFNFGGNADLFLNSVNWLAEEEDLISIRPKPRDFSNAQLTKRTGYIIFYTSVIILPFLILVIGGVIWVRRKKL